MSTARNAAEEMPLSQPPDTSSLFPGLASSSRHPSARLQDPVPGNSEIGVASDEPPLAIPGIFPEASLNFGVAVACEPHAYAQHCPAQEEEQYPGNHAYEAAIGGLAEKSKQGTCTAESSHSGYNPMCTPSSAGTSRHGGELIENVPPLQQQTSAADACHEHVHPHPDTSPLASWKAVRLMSTGESGVARPMTQAPGSSHAWLENVIQPIVLLPADGVGPTDQLPSTSLRHGNAAAEAANPTGAAASEAQVPASSDAKMHNHENGLQGVQAIENDVDVACDMQFLSMVAKDAAVAAKAVSGRAEMLADEGLRPRFSSNSPELVDRYKNVVAEPVACLVVPDLPQDGELVSAADSGGSGAMARQLILSSLPAFEGAPFSVLPRVAAVERLHADVWLSRPLSDPTESQPTANPGEHASQQWLAALEGHAAPKSFNAQCQHAATTGDAATPLMLQQYCNPVDDQERCLGVRMAQVGCRGCIEGGTASADLKCDGKCPDVVMPKVAAAETSGIDQVAPSATRRAYRHRCEAWLTEQLAYAQRCRDRGEDRDDRLISLRTIADARQALPARRRSGMLANAHDARAQMQPKFNLMEQNTHLLAEVGCAAARLVSHETANIQRETQNGSPSNSSMKEPFAWRGKLPGATARAAALQIRTFCALSQQSDDDTLEARLSADGRGSSGRHRKVPGRQKNAQSRLIVPFSPDLATAKRMHREMRKGEPLTASKEHARRVTDVGRKRATVLAGHFRGSYAQRAAVFGRLRKAGGAVGYAALAKQKKSTWQDDM